MTPKKPRAAKPANQNADGRTAWQKARDSWEVRGFIFLLRVFACLLVVIYLFFTARAAWTWTQAVWVRHQPLSAVTEVAQESIADNDLARLSGWVSYRPASDVSAMVALLEPYTAKMPSAVFMSYASKFMILGDSGQGVFWHQYARYRLQFDAMRCGAEDSMDIMKGIRQLWYSPKVDAALRADPALVEKSVRQVLDYDARFPAHNAPDDTCAVIQNISDRTKESEIAPEPYWASVRHALRISTENGLRAEADREAADKEKAPVSKGNSK
jgi:hypothetical protein